MTNEEFFSDLAKIDMAKRIAKVRHEATRYDKFAAFYAAQPNYRKELNGLCRAVLYDKITIEDFFSKVKCVEEKVDLYDKRNRKAFLNMEINRIRSISSPQTSDKQVYELAELSVNKIIKRQDKQNCGKKL